jgi:2-methylcitrate dehydratase PrpD
MSETLATRLGRFVADLRFEDMPHSVVDKAKALVNHAVTVGMVSIEATPTTAARRAVLQDEGLGKRQVGRGQGATIWVDGSRATRVGTVFANAVSIAVNNQCDSYQMLTHPGVQIVPAALAAAEGEGRSGRELLTAVIAGYEVQCRCARDFIPSTPARGFRASPVYGILGCAASTAKLLGLDATQTTHAIALAASFAGSLIEGQRTGARDSHFAEAQAARSGVWAAILAAQGFQGARTALEGEGGFYNAFIGNNRGELSYAFNGPLKASLEDITAKLGETWEVLNVKFKVYPTVGFNQPVIWLAKEMVAEHAITATDIETATLEMNFLETQYPTPRFPQPPAADGSRFGRTHFILARTLADGDFPVLEANIEHAGEASAPMMSEQSARIAELQSRIEIIGVVGRDCFAPRLTVTLRNGLRLAKEYNGRELMWDFAKDAEVLERFIPGLPVTSDQYRGMVSAIGNLETAVTIDEVLRSTLAKA